MSFILDGGKRFKYVHEYFNRGYWYVDTYSILYVSKFGIPTKIDLKYDIDWDKFKECSFNPLVDDYVNYLRSVHFNYLQDLDKDGSIPELKITANERSELHLFFTWYYTNIIKINSHVAPIGEDAIAEFVDDRQFQYIRTNDYHGVHDVLCTSAGTLDAANKIITLHVVRGKDPHITDRIFYDVDVRKVTQRDLLSWLQHLSGKGWFTVKMMKLLLASYKYLITKGKQTYWA